MFQTKFVKKIETQFMANKLLFPKIVPFMRYVEKIWYNQTSHPWQYNMEHALCILDK